MTGAGSARLLADKRGQGLIVYGEVTAAALATAAQCDMGSWSHGAAYLTSPPLRPDPETPQILMDLLSRWKFVKIRLVVVGGGGVLAAGLAKHLEGLKWKWYLSGNLND